MRWNQNWHQVTKIQTVSRKENHNGPWTRNKFYFKPSREVGNLPTKHQLKCPWTSGQYLQHNLWSVIQDHMTPYIWPRDTKYPRREPCITCWPLYSLKTELFTICSLSCHHHTNLIIKRHGIFRSDYLGAGELNWTQTMGNELFQTSTIELVHHNIWIIMSWDLIRMMSDGINVIHVIGSIATFQLWIR
jgi:hypothetical protein